MTHLTDYDRAVLKSARKIARLEVKVAEARAKLDEMKAVDELIERVAIAPLVAGIAADKELIAGYDAALAASDNRMAELKAKLAASKARAKGL